MALNIKDPVTQALAEDVAALAGETKARAIQTALRERKDRLEGAALRRSSRAERMDRFLRQEAWPQIPKDVRGRQIPKAERQAILGYGAECM